MKPLALLTLAAALAGCSSFPSMPPIGTIAVPVGQPPLGTAALSRVEFPAPGTRLSFTTTGDTIGNDRLRWEIHEREIAVTVFDYPQPWPAD
jgi:hypothetical protein